jgi:acyl-CoA synthetase (AMP-forming)/AMP-acid ligase II
MNGLVQVRSRLDPGKVFNDLLALLSGDGAATAVYEESAGGRRIGRRQMVADIEALSGSVTAADRASRAAGSAWVSCRDRYLLAVAALGCLRTGSVALAETKGPPAMFDTMAGHCPPAVVVSDSAGTAAAQWAAARGVPVRVISRPAPGRHTAGQPAGAPDAEAALQFFTSGTTGPAQCVSIRGPQLLAALGGVTGRLRLSPADISLSIAPLTHTLGFITTVLVPLTAGGAVSFADPLRPSSLDEAISRTQPTWCATSPSGLKLVRTLTSSAGLRWPGLRFLRSSAASLPAALAAELEQHFGVPVINAYVMTEAPGEIASQDLDGDRCPGTVGRPTMCQVRVRSGPDAVPDGAVGEIWIRGPNVAVTPSPDGELPWLPTGDVGCLDQAGFLRITGRSSDIINQGGLKVWPPDVEAVALGHPDVAAAVAFPVPHQGLGQTVGLAVVPRAGRSLDRSAVRRLLMAGLPRDKWPSTIVVCGQLPLTDRGKISRHAMWRLLELEAR